MKFINRCLYKFSVNVIRDQIYEFDKSAISLSVRINSLKDFNDFQKLRDLKIHRIIYNLNDQAELMEFLAEHNDECIKKIFDPSFFICISWCQCKCSYNTEGWQFQKVRAKGITTDLLTSIQIED
ncbi:unnamed protein product [Paramecium octaurelia]|uniref:Uncharacterized protein n=1 Tax=Paramecium octaurelia TaxID=43137 RepID=A0A8S1TLN2_PAROT|nr:unnamed protein product [Paramecium octaurelia]